MAARKRAGVDYVPRRVADPDGERVMATRELLLDTAERLFIAHGYDEVSVRSINAAAGVNPGAIHYHFGSKQGLVIALLEARVDTRGMEIEFRGMRETGVVELAAVVRREIEWLATQVRHPGRGRLYVQLMARAVLGQWDVTWTSPLFRTAIWTDMVGRALPHLRPDVVIARWDLATTLALTETARPLQNDPGAELQIDTDSLVAFIVGGLAAPLDER
jgi:AcrR family transcriptional regulator